MTVLDLNFGRFNWDWSKAIRSLKCENSRNWHIVNIEEKHLCFYFHIFWTLNEQFSFLNKPSCNHRCVGPGGSIGHPSSLSLIACDSSLSLSTVAGAAVCHPESPLGLKILVPQLLGILFIQTTLRGQPSSVGALADRSCLTQGHVALGGQPTSNDSLKQRYKCWVFSLYSSVRAPHKFSLCQGQ